MPPKKIGQKKQGESKTEKQTKLVLKEEAEEKPEKAVKTKSKQFNETSNPGKAGSQNHTHLWEYGSGVTPSKLFISSWNVNGIRAVMGKQDLQNYIKKSDPDIICFNETKIDFAAFEKDKIKVPGYHGYWNFCKCSSGYSGVAVFSKYLPISVVEDLPLHQEHSQQGRMITIQFEKFYLITAYIPNSGQKLDRLEYRVKEWDKCFQAYCNDLKKKKTTIICGDLNVCHKDIDIARPKGNEKTAGFTPEERNSFAKFL